MVAQADAERYFSKPSGIAALWAGLLAGPAAWALHLQTSYSITPFFHGPGSTLALYLVTLAALAIAAAGGLIARRNWQRAGAAWPGGEGGVIARSRFMALSGMIISAYFFVIILAQAVPIMILRS
ncbi:uncharacterized protein sS8_0937 [Methylocaldum marinum]|uniref:Uncharacterized protein n=1 Tax=Methylocaldum marinum TaxID=1432792 RepID=A0A250KN00_9GAMM|nr:hypothetical protein [Methylocaldum marinum]BBA32902.1 uncharacterized protein sS8_0937 [Methylocaldum marinum]